MSLTWETRMKFNPDIHSAVVGNFRTLFKQRYGRDPRLTDIQIWHEYEYWLGCTDSDEPEKTSDDITVEGMKAREEEIENETSQS